MSFPLKSTKNLKDKRFRNTLTTDETPLTYKSALDKTGIMFFYSIAFMVVGWMLAYSLPPALILGLITATLVLVIAIAFIKYVPPALGFIILTFEGLLVGFISRILEDEYQSIVMQAVLATVIVVSITLAIAKSGKVRVTERFRSILFIALSSYLIFSIVNIILSATGLVNDPWGIRGITVFGIPLGIIIGVIAVFLGAATLLTDIQDIDEAVAAGVPDKYGWQFGLGITLTIIWIYIEILRITQMLRQ